MDEFLAIYGSSHANHKLLDCGTSGMTQYWNYEPRRPRHQATDVHTTILVRRSGESPRDWVEAELVDISRNGIRFRNSPLFAPDDELELSIPLDDQSPNRCVPAHVRWCEQREDQFEVACQCDIPVEWEVIGELILAGALNTK